MKNWSFGRKMLLSVPFFNELISPSPHLDKTQILGSKYRLFKELCVKGGNIDLFYKFSFMCLLNCEGENSIILYIQSEYKDTDL